MSSPWYVLTGGPCSGKTTLIEELRSRGYTVVPESARTIIGARIAAGETVADVLADPLALERSVLAHQKELAAALPEDETAFFDRGIPDNMAYVRRFQLPEQEFMDAAKAANYRKVFLLDMIGFVADAERYETPEQAAALHDGIRRAYEELGYEVAPVPVIPVSERADFILSRL